MARKTQTNFQYGAFLAEKVLKLPPQLLDKDARSILFSKENIKSILTPTFLKQTKRSWKNILQDYGSKERVKRRRVEEATFLSASSKKSRDLTKTLLDALELDVLAKEGLSRDDTKLKDFKKKFAAAKRQGYSLDDILKVRSPQASPPSSGASFLNSNLNSATPFINAPTQLNNTDEIVSTLKNIYSSQTASATSLKANFKLIFKHLDDIEKAIKNINIPEQQSSLLDSLLPGSKKKGVTKPLAKSKLLGLTPKIAGVAASAVAAYDYASTVKAINQATDVGLFSPEQAATLKKNALIKTGAEAAGTVAGATIGGLTLGPIGGVGGGYLGYLGGQKLASSFQKDNLDPTAAYLATVANIESSLKAKPPSTGTSSAAGLFQFMPKTWENLNMKYKKGWDITTQNDPRLDAKKSIEMMKLLTKENQMSLEKNLGRQVTGPELYTAHFLGIEDALKTMRSDPSMSAAQLLPKAAAANPNIFYDKEGQARSIMELQTLLKSKFQQKATALGLPTTSSITSIPTLVAPTTEPTQVETLPALPENSMQNLLKGETSSLNTDRNLKEQMVTSFDKLLKVPALTQPTLQASKSPSPIVISQNSTQQNAMDDINSLHFTSGLFLNLIT